MGDRRWASLPLSVPFRRRPNLLADRRCRFAFAALSVPFPRRPNLNGFAVAPSPQLRNPCCSLRLGEGPASQMLQATGNARTEESPAAASPFRKRRNSFRRGLPYLGASIPRRNPPGRSPLSLRLRSPIRAVSPQAKPLNGFAVAPPPLRGNPCCSLRLGEGPALQMLQAAGNARNEERPAAASPFS
jgi:hypothetical protein